MRLILTLNAGSSSVKFRLFGLDQSLSSLASGKVADIGDAPVFKAQKEDGGAKQEQPLPVHFTHEEAVDIIFDWLQKNAGAINDISAATHRIVHGGERYAAPALLTSEAMSYLDSLCPLAPLHQPHNLACVRILAKKRPGLAQYGCFDTAFHARHEPIFTSFALPEKIREKGVRRYGFHGLSYDWIAQCLRRDYPRLAAGRAVVAHLGNGASLCAMKDGQSVDTTMGMTALDGLPMGTRCGSIDAGAIIYMQRELGLPLDELEPMLYEESGLKGLSGMTNDVKTLCASDQDSARFALAYFAMKTAQFIAGMAVAIGGMDLLVFTGGIGENAKSIRDAILGHLSFMPTFETLIIPDNEEFAMAQAVAECFGIGRA